MTPEEFTALPPSMALGILLGASHPATQKKIAEMEPPKVPSCPRYDRKVFRKSGFQWASELDLKGLEFFCGRAKDSADSGGKFAEADRKQYDALIRWVEYRRVEPTKAVNVTRDEKLVTAAAPSQQPAITAKLPPKSDPQAALPADSGYDGEAFNEDEAF